MGINSIKVKRVVRPLDLGDYQEEYSGTIVEVWVNPPLKITQQVPELIQNWEKATLKRALLEKPVKSEEKSEEKSADANSGDDLGPSSLEDGTAPMGLDAPRLEEIEAAVQEEQAAKLAYYDWFAQVWEDSSKEEVRALVARLEVEEPGMLAFLRNRTLQMLTEYLGARKKA